MSEKTERCRNEGRAVDRLFEALADARRRLLGALRSEQPDAVSVATLAAEFAAGVAGVPRDRISAAERHDASIALHHVHLPKLDAAGLIDWDRDAATVSLADHQAYADPGIQAAFDDSGSRQSLDVLFEALSDGRRRTILDVLSHQYEAIRTQTLAREVAARERGTSQRDVSTDAVNAAFTALHQRHLPALADASLIEYDSDRRTVAYTGHPALRVAWMHSYVGPDFRASLTESATKEDVWNLEGRERIVSYGQALCEAADDELFMLFTSTGLLEAGCYTRIEQAVDRGVDVMLGTRDPTVREFVRERAPSVTLWEPETDWLDLPVEEDTVGRLVFADREALMIGTLDDTVDGVQEERAITGDGPDDALVALLRHLLRSRFDEREAIEAGPPL